jgi:hypothetical protein
MFRNSINENKELDRPLGSSYFFLLPSARDREQWGEVSFFGLVLVETQIKKIPKLTIDKSVLIFM